MKRFIKIIAFALIGILCASCVEKEKIVYHPGQATGGQLNAIASEIVLDSENETAVCATFTFGASTYGVQCPVQYGLWASINESFENEKKLGTIGSAAIKDGISVTHKAMNNQLISWGCEADVPVTVYFRIKSDMMGEKNPIDGTTIISNVISSSITPYLAEKEYAWFGVPGNYQGWAPDGYPRLYNYSEDGNVYTGIIDFRIDETKPGNGGFKIAEGAWDDDKTYGGPAGLESDTDVIQLEQPGNDIKCWDNADLGNAHRFYYMSFDKGKKTLTRVMAFDQVGVIGLNGDWDNDHVMEFNIYKDRFYVDVEVPAATEFKFRLDGGWDTNWGGSLDNLSKGGDNIPVEAGNYRIYFYLSTPAVHAELNAGMYGKEEPGAEPGPEPPVPGYQGWGIIGVGGDWENDIEMTEKDGVWTGYATIAAGEGFKIRKDADWADNRGATGDADPYVVTLGEPFAVVLNGKNLSVPVDGFYKIVYNTADETITVSDGTVWGVVGAFNSWGGDVFMTQTDGIWTSDAIELKAGEGFKIRKNSAWDENRGAAGDADPFEITPGEPFAVTHNGKDLTVPADGKYIVSYNSADETITVSKALPDNVWGLIGVDGDWDNDIFMTEVLPGIWVSPATELATEFKIRYNHDWAVNRGFDQQLAMGESQPALPDGKNITVAESGTYVVVYDSTNEIIYLQGWSLIGTIGGTSWDTDFPMMPVKDEESGQVIWLSYSIDGAEGQEFKIRYNCNWDINRGGVFADFCEPFAVALNGENIKLTENAAVTVAYNPAEEEIVVARSNWGVVGSFNDWGNDVVMLETEKGIYTAVIVLQEESSFKIRKDKVWGGADRGGVFAALGTPFEVTQGGPDIKLGAGTYEIEYDSNKETMTIDSVE